MMEASRTLLLLPLMVGLTQRAEAQLGGNGGRGPSTFTASNSPGRIALPQPVPTHQQALIFTEAVPRLVVDQSFQFGVAAINPDGSRVRLTEVTWRSSNEEVATVSETGMVVARSLGRTFVTASSGRYDVRVRVTVLRRAPLSRDLVASLELTPSEADVEAGTTLQFAASARSSEGAVIPEAPVQYSTNDTAVAEISPAGLLTAKRMGTVRITARAGDAVSRVAITIGRARVAALTVTPSTVAATTGDTVVLAVSGKRRDGSDVAQKELRVTAQRGTFRDWTYVAPTSAGADTIIVTSSDGYTLRIPATIRDVMIPTVSTRSPAPAPAPVPDPAVPPVAVELPPVTDGALPPFTVPARPTATVNVTAPAVTGRTIRVAAGDVAGLQAAINSAVGGDEIVLPNGSDFIGNLELPRHGGSGVVTIRSENVGVASGTRMTPAAASGLARIGTRSAAAAIATKPGASGWRLTGLHISLRAGAVDNYGIVVVGSGSEASAAEFVSNIVLDRVFVTGNDYNTSRCVAMNGQSLAVIDSWLADCHAKGRDAQGVGGWTGAGPYLIRNNHIEGSGQAIMFGGSDPRIAGLVPSDITILGNHLYKPMSWANGRWTVKATFELKNARRVLFEGNVLENHWMDAQVGYAILFQAANQDGGAPWTTIQDVTVQNNVVRNSTSGINMLSRLESAGAVTQPTQRVLVRNNLFIDVGRDPVNGMSGRYVQLLSDLRDISLVQNTFLGTMPRSAMMMEGAPQVRATFANNLFGVTEYGVFGSGTGEGAGTLRTFTPGGTFRGNVVAGRPVASYPEGNMFPATVGTSDFVNPAGGDYTLRRTLSWSASGSSLVGVDGQALLSATRSTVTP